MPATAEASGRADHHGRHRERVFPSCSRRSTVTGRRGREGESSAARLARAEAQVFAIVAERMRARSMDPAHARDTAAVLGEVAAHRLDPYAAADRLLAEDD